MEKKRRGQLKLVPLENIVPYEGNPRIAGENQHAVLQLSIEGFGFVEPIIAWEDPELEDGKLMLVAGHQRYEGAIKANERMVPVIVYPFHDKREAIAYNIMSNKSGELSTWDFPKLKDNVELLDTGDFNLELTGFSLGELEDVMTWTHKGEAEGQVVHAGCLAERFVVPPFTVLDARQGYWQVRKEMWKALGVKGERGRDTDLMLPNQERLNVIAGTDYETGSSVFDPVLAELLLRWFCVPRGRVFDPFAGEAVKGAVAGCLGHEYVGVELRQEQVKENRRVWQAVGKALKSSKEARQPKWLVGDAAAVVKAMAEKEAGSFDMVYSSPPYYDLEVYSKDARDGSVFSSYTHFRRWLAGIVKASAQLLRPGRFMALKMGEVRDKRGVYYNLVGDTVRMCQEAGLQYYNEAILVTAIGTLPVRVGRAFTANRKLGKTHQNVLVFYKGDVRSIRSEFPTLEVGAGEDAAGE